MEISVTFQIVCKGSVGLLSLLIILCLIRAVTGKTAADKLMAVNMMGTMVMVIIGLLTLMLSEGYLIDIAYVYAVLSFLAVIVFCKIQVGRFKEMEKKEMRKEETPEAKKEEVLHE